MIEKPKKERRFLKILGKVGEILVQELLLKVGKSLVQKIGGKKHLPSIIFLSLFYNIAFASVDSIPYPITGNKQRLGWQTSGNGLVWRGLSADTITKPTSYADKNVKAYLILDSVSGSLYVFKQGVWAAISGAGGGLTMPFDSITFNTAKDGTVGVGEVEYNDTQGSLIQGLKGGNVTNVIGQQLHQRVNNRTGSTLAKGDVVYLSGSQGNRITVVKALATSDPTSANTFGIVAESIADNASGYVITEGLITGLNTLALTQDSAVYLSGTTAGALTSTKPQAPIHGVYIGVCVKSNAGSGEIFVKIRNGQELDELHDVQITSPVNNASLYYKSSEGLWRDTTASLLVSDTAAMLANYATKAYADTTGRFYARQDFSNVSSSTLTWIQSDTLIPGEVNVVQVYRNGQILLPSQYTIPTSTSVVIASASYKAGENYTVIFPRGGGAGSGGGSGSLTSISAGTGITVSPNPITTTGTVSADLSVLMELTDTVSLSNRINLKLNATDTASLSSRIDAKGTGTVTSVASGYGLTGGTITSTGTLRLDSATVYNYIRDSIVDVQIGNDTIKILKQEYNNVTSDTLTWTITSKFPIQLRAYILLFRNGQLLINDQYSIIDTNKIKVAATSYKLGENYTVVTVSGIGSAGISQTGNPVYPEAGIALSTGTAWTTSIPNNSTNWNTAYNDKINSLAVTGTTTKTITLTQQDGGTVSGNFTDNGSVTSVDMTVPTGLSIAGNPITTNGTLALAYASGYSLPTDANQNNWTIAYNDKIASLAFTGTSTKTLTLNQTDGGTVSNTFTDLQGIVAADTASMLTPYLRKADTTLLNLTSRFAAKLNLSDTASMLTNYLRTGVAASTYQAKLNGTGFVKASGTTISYDNSTYLTTGTAASTYLPLTGGTLSGNLYTKYLNTFAKTTYIPFNAGIGEQSIFNVGTTLRGGTVMVFPDSNLVGSSANIFLGNSSVEGVEYSAMGSGMRNYAKQNGDSRRNSLAFYTSGIGSQNTNRLFIDYDGNVGINDDTPSYKLDVNGTLGVTGATTLSNLAGTGDRMVIAGSGGALSTQAIQTEMYYINLGIVAGAADNSASTYDYSYPANIFIIPTSLNGYCIDSVYIRAIGCSTCPPVSPDLDYYVGVYKANAGARVTTSGASLQGSQITMNEYDLNQVNVNYSLSTGEAWWVYLNGTYTSDMAYITAGFVVKKTCN